MLPSFVLSSAVAMSGERDGASAASRRRERPPALVVAPRAAVRAHGADRCHTPQCREGGARRDVLRPAGIEDGQRREAAGSFEGPWAGVGEAVTVGHVAASVPPLGVPLVQGDVGVDAAARSSRKRRRRRTWRWLQV